MGSKLDIYKFGTGGVQLTKGEKHLADTEVVKAQNAELVIDTERGGEGTIGKRGGLITLTAVLSGNIAGMAEVRFINLQPDMQRATAIFDTDALDTLNGTPVIIAPANGGLLLPYMAKVRLVRSGGTAWSSAPQLQVIYQGNTTNLLQALSIDGLTSNPGSTVDKFYSMWTATSFTGTSGVKYNNTALQVKLSSDTNPGSDATMTVEVLYQTLFGLY